jgi:hypothetical protein
VRRGARVEGPRRAAWFATGDQLFLRPTYIGGPHPPGVRKRRSCIRSIRVHVYVRMDTLETLENGSRRLVRGCGPTYDDGRDLRRVVGLQEMEAR